MGQENKTTLEFHEVEVKFRMEGEKLFEWKKLVAELDGLKGDPIYVESDDIYYTKKITDEEEFEFVRYRFSNLRKDKRAELTIKSKTKSGDNIVRKETNVRVDNNDKATVESFVNGLGFEYNFRISKMVWIYNFEDATLPFYSVIDENGKVEHFAEIEVNEEKLKELTEDQAWDIIKKYEEILAPLGITHKNRLRKSLFEMYRKG